MIQTSGVAKGQDTFQNNWVHFFKSLQNALPPNEQKGTLAYSKLGKTNDKGQSEHKLKGHD